MARGNFEPCGAQRTLEEGNDISLFGSASGRIGLESRVVPLVWWNGAIGTLHAKGRFFGCGRLDVCVGISSIKYEV
jgi:hypothetical protein